MIGDSPKKKVSQKSPKWRVVGMQFSVAYGSSQPSSKIILLGIETEQF